MGDEMSLDEAAGFLDDNLPWNLWKLAGENNRAVVAARMVLDHARATAPAGPAASGDLAALRELHVPAPAPDEMFCTECGNGWPCRTARLLATPTAPGGHESEGDLAAVRRTIHDEVMTAIKAKAGTVLAPVVVVDAAVDAAARIAAGADDSDFTDALARAYDHGRRDATPAAPTAATEGGSFVGRVLDDPADLAALALPGTIVEDATNNVGRRDAEGWRLGGGVHYGAHDGAPVFTYPVIIRWHPLAATPRPATGEAGGGDVVRQRAATEAQTMCCHGTGECGIGPDCGQDRARLDALNEAANWIDATPTLSTAAAPQGEGGDKRTPIGLSEHDRDMIEWLLALSPGTCDNHDFAVFTDGGVAPPCPWCAPPAPEVVSGAEAAALPVIPGAAAQHLPPGSAIVDARDVELGTNPPARVRLSGDGWMPSSWSDGIVPMLPRGYHVVYRAAPTSPEPALAVGDEVTTFEQLDRLPEGTWVENSHGSRGVVTPTHAVLLATNIQTRALPFTVLGLPGGTS